LTVALKLPGFTSFSVTGSSLTMPGKAAKITITERQQEILQAFSRAVTAPSRLRQRASIILMGFDGLLNEDIAERVDLTRRQVGRWRRRWAQAWNQLVDIECLEPRAVLRRAIEAVLTDEPRPGAPGTFTPKQVTQILAVALRAAREVGTAHHALDGQGIDRGGHPARHRGVDLAVPGESLPARGRLATPQEPVLASTPPRRIPSALRSRSRRSVTRTSRRRSGSEPTRRTRSAWTR